MSEERLHEREIQRYRIAIENARRRLQRDYDTRQQELDAIEAEREIEREELAQEEQTADVDTRVAQNQFAELRRIDGALERIERGQFGICVDCGQPVSRDRLDAEPWAATCAQCAQEHRRADEPHRGDPADRPQDREEDVPDEVGDRALRGAPLPPELAMMEDEEVAETIREAFREEVGESLDGVRIACCDGVVTLAGEVPNEALPEVARRIVEDELGFEVVDRMQVIDTAGGPRGEMEDPAAARHPVPPETLETTDEDMEIETSEDILEAEEEGLVFVPPTRPVPER
jgi:DnaK suppressor protein